MTKEALPVSAQGENPGSSVPLDSSEASLPANHRPSEIPVRLNNRTDSPPTPLYNQIEQPLTIPNTILLTETIKKLKIDIPILAEFIDQHGLKLTIKDAALVNQINSNLAENALTQSTIRGQMVDVCINCLFNIRGNWNNEDSSVWYPALNRTEEECIEDPDRKVEVRLLSLLIVRMFLRSEVTRSQEILAKSLVVAGFYFDQEPDTHLPHSMLKADLAVLVEAQPERAALWEVIDFGISRPDQKKKDFDPDSELLAYFSKRAPKTDAPKV